MALSTPAMSRRGLITSFGAGALAAGLAPPALAQWRMGRGEAALRYALPDAPGDLGLALEARGACAAGTQAEPTERQTEGPFYSPDTPQRSDFSGDGPGVALVVTGRVLDAACRPLAGAVLDVWHADSRGDYDNAGYRFRGHLFTDRSGAFRLTTIRPSGYSAGGMARTPHIHVKLQGRGTALLTTQLYFPDEENGWDRIFDPSLVMDLSSTEGVQTGRYDFVLPRA